MDTQQLPDQLAGCRVVEAEFGHEELAEVAAHDHWRLTRRGRRATRCTRKRAYGRSAAARAARKLAEAQGEDVHYYACPRCGGWHVGHRAVAWPLGRARPVAQGG